MGEYNQRERFQSCPVGWPLFSVVAYQIAGVVAVGSLPAGINWTGATPPKKGGRGCRTLCRTPCRTPPASCRARGKKGGVSPVLPFPAGAARSGRRYSTNTCKTSWLRIMAMSRHPCKKCPTPPLCLRDIPPDPGLDPGPDPSNRKYSLADCASLLYLRHPQTARNPRLIAVDRDFGCAQR